MGHSSDVYLVFRNDVSMKMFLKLLLYSMRSLDGTRNSAEKLIYTE